MHSKYIHPHKFIVAVEKSKRNFSILFYVVNVISEQIMEVRQRKNFLLQL